MAIPAFTDDISFISKLGDNPGADNGLTTEEFRALFDAAPLALQNYINTVLIPAIAPLIDPTEGMTMRGALDMSGQKLYGLKTPYESTDAVPFGYANEKYQYKSVRKVATLDKTAWADGSLTLYLDGVTSNNDIDVGAAPASYKDYTGANVRCVSQALGKLVFECDSIPDKDLTVNIRIWN
jgi:hypothetical protein